MRINMLYVTNNEKTVLQKMWIPLNINKRRERLLDQNAAN